jgi:hypothetical protein
MKPDQIFSAGSVGVQWELRGRCGAWKLGSRVRFLSQSRPVDGHSAPTAI